MVRRAQLVRGGFPTWRAEPIPWLTVAVLSGLVGLGPFLVVKWTASCGSVALFLVAALAGHRRGGRLSLLLGAAIFGAGLGGASQPGPIWAGEVLVQGTVRSVQGPSAVVDSPLGSSRLWFSDLPPEVGTRLSARCHPSNPRPRLPGAPDSARADRAAGRVQLRVRDWIPIGVVRPRETLPDAFAAVPHGDLLWALATGQRPELDPRVTERMRRTGTAHLLAISGLHVGIVAGVVWGIMALVSKGARRVWPRLTRSAWWTPAEVLPGVCAAVLYADSVGWPVSARRAVVMVVIASLARSLGRPIRSWTTLSLAALVVVVGAPESVFGLGFGLSFGAVTGILAVTPRLLRWCPPDLPRGVGWCMEAVAVTVGAMAGTLPLTAWWFQSLSPLGPLCNLLAGPLMGGVGVPAALLAAHGPTWLQAPSLWVGSHAMELTMWVLAGLDLPPWHPAVGPLGAGLLALALAFRRNILLWPLVAGLALWGPGMRVPAHLEVTFLSVGQGDAVFVHWPDGRRWLVDGGPPSQRVVEWLRREGHTHLDAVFLTHPDSDHLGGLESVVDELSIGRFVTARPPRKDESSYRRVWGRLFERGIPVATAADPPGPGAQLLHPTLHWREALSDGGRPKDNDDSLVLLLEASGHRVLLTGDIEDRAEQRLVGRVGKVDLVQAPHHGSRSSSSSRLVAEVDPEWVVVSCGLRNRFGHPHPRTLAQWRGRRMVRTDTDGTIRARVTPSGIEVGGWSHWWGFQPLLPRPWRPRPP